MTISLCNELARTHSVSLIISRAGPLLVNIKPGVSVKIIETKFLIIFALRCIAHCKSLNVDIALSNIWPLTVYVQFFKAIIFGKLRHVTIDHSPHDVELARCNVWVRFILEAISRVSYRSVDLSLVVSSSIALGMSKLKFRPSQVIEIDVPIPIPIFSRFMDLKDMSRMRILTVASNKPEKNLLLGLRLLRMVRSLRFDFEWYVVGRGVTALESHLSSEFSELRRHVLLVEETLYVDAFYRQSDYYLSTSLTEGKPLAVIEALSYGLGVVSTPSTPALKDLLTHNGVGYISADFTEESLCDGLIDLIKTDSLELKQRRRTIATRYSASHIVCSLLRTLEPNF